MRGLEPKKLPGLTLFLLSLCSCTYLLQTSRTVPAETPPTPPAALLPPPMASQVSPSLAARLRARQAKAEKFMRQTDLAAALIQWEILHVLVPDNEEFSRQFKATQTLIQEKADTHLRLGQQAFKRGDFERAKREFLSVLALDPRQSQPWTVLRSIEERHLETWQRTKLARLADATNKTVPRQAQDNHQPRQGANADADRLERGLVRFHQGDLEASIRELRTYLTTSPESQKAKQYLAAAHFELGRHLHRQGNMTEALAHFEAAGKSYPINLPQIHLYIQQIKSALAHDYYRKGLQIYRTDLAKAIQFWQISLSYDPQHTSALTHLENAYQLQHMLLQFQGK